MSDYKVFNDNGEERTWEELYEDNVKLQQENQKLKDRNKLLEKHYKQGEKNLGTQIDITLKYEKVLDEIREHIKNENYKDENICVVDGIEILQILDKVGKE